MKVNICKGHRPKIDLNVYRVEPIVWKDMEFYKHHYLSSELNPSAICLMFTWNSQPVAFVALLNTPRKGLPNDMAVSRLVILPEYQGLGLSSVILNFCGGIISNKGNGARLNIKTIHDKVGTFLEKSTNWKPTSHNQKYRKDLEGKVFEKNIGFARSSYCYVYCGQKISGYENLIQPILKARENKVGVQEFCFD